ncbi:hypothetical protein K0651_08315 [Ornithinimicrobium sp. Arc0846-15]|nr:hypothetical protein [Ornithinimicrobium laminariae]
MIARYSSAVVRRIRWRIELQRTAWTVVLAMDLDSADVRAQAASALGDQPTMWITTSTQLGRTFPDTWIVHRLDPDNLPADVLGTVMRWALGTMRVTKLVDLCDLDSDRPMNAAAIRLAWESATAPPPVPRDPLLERIKRL